MPKIAAAVAALLATACVVIPVPLPLGFDRWTLSADHARLATGDLAMACRPDGTLAVTAEAFSPVPSNEELSVGAGGDAHLLVADVVGAAGPGVTATGAIPAAFLDGLAASGRFSVRYGAESLGPLSPPAGLVERFVAACRAVA